MPSSTNNQVSIVPADEHNVDPFENSYTSSGDKICSHGRDYQYKVIVYLMCKQLNANSENFRLACEMDDAGKFDDIVLHYVENNEWKYKLYQLKHISGKNKKINSNKIFEKESKNSRYSLNMYFDSFEKEIKAKNFENKHEGKIVEVILMTNVGLDFSNDLHKNIFEKCNEEIGVVYKFKKGREVLVHFLKYEHSLRGKVLNENGDLSVDAEDFFSKLRIRVDFCDEEAERKTKDEIKKFLRVDDEEYVDNVYKDLYNNIARWVCDPRGYFVGRRKCMEWFTEAKEKIKNPSDVFSEFHLNRIRTHDVRFIEESLRKFRNIFEQNARVCHVRTRCSVDFSLVKVVQCLEEGTFRLIGDDEFITYDKNKLINDLRLNEIRVLVIACFSCKTLDIPSWERIKFIIVAKSISLTVNNVQCIDDEFKFIELVPSKQEELLEKEIRFQTRCRKVQQVFRPDIRHIIGNDFLFKLVTSADPVEIDSSADRLRSTDAFYIDRRVTYGNEIDMARFGLNDRDDVYVFSGMTETQLRELREEKSVRRRDDFSNRGARLDDSKRDERESNGAGETDGEADDEADVIFLLPERNPEEQFKRFCESYTGKNVVWIEHSETRFYLRKASRSIRRVRDFVREGITNRFDDRLLTDLNDDIIIVCADPGMGKSTLLSRLASNLIEDEDRHAWILHVNLTDHVKDFGDRKTFDVDSATEFIADSRRFGAFERSLFAEWPEVTILFDAFDEIAPDHRRAVVELVTSLNRKERFRMFLTSRPNEKEYLEDVFNRLCYRLDPFDKENMASFLTNRWNPSGDVDRDRSTRFIDALIDSVKSSTVDRSERLMNTPLECRLIGDVFEKEHKVFVEGRDDPPLPKRVDVLELFEEFVLLKWKIYVEEKKKQYIHPASPLERKHLEDSFILFKENHRLASVYLLFGDKIDLDNLKRNDSECILDKKEKRQLKRFLKEIESGDEKTGIIQSVRDSTPKYTHRMFAEYFAAEFFHELVEDDREKSREFLAEAMFHSERKTFKLFFDRLSIKDRTSSKIFKILLNCDEDRFDDFIDKEESSTFVSSTDKFGRNALHLCATYEFNNIFQQLLRREFDMNARDDFFGYTPVQYACVAQMWKNLDLLLTKSDENITDFISDKIQCLLHASKNGYKEIVRNLMEHTEATHRDELINTIDEDKKTPLYYAAISGHVSLTKYVMAETNVNLSHKYDYDGNTILHSLARISEERDGSVEIVRLLANTDLVNTRNIEGRTPLHYAANCASKSVYECLLNANKADVFVIDNSKLTLLHMLVATHDEQKIGIVKELICRGISIDTRDEYGRTPLHIACEFGSRAFCEYLITEMRADIEAVTNRNWTALHYLAKNKNDDVVEVARSLISEGVSIEARDVDGRTALHVACWSGTRAFCEYLIAEMRADIEAVNNRNWTALHYLAQNKNENMVEVARSLISKGLSIEARHDYGSTPLLVACSYGSRALCEYLITEMKADVKAVNNSNCTTLHSLAENNNENMFEVARLLISEGVPIEARDENGRTALHFACLFGSRAFCERLITEMRADIEAVTNRNSTTLHCLAENKNDNMIGVARSLVSGGVSVEARDEYGRTALHIACAYGSRAFCERLITEMKADIEAVDNRNCTTLHYLAQNQNGNTGELARSFVSEGVSIEARDEYGRTALHIACAYGTRAFCEYLITEMKADVTAVGNGNRTALHYLAQNKNDNTVGVARSLVSEGVSIEARDEDGRTALHLACSFGSRAFCEYLIAEVNADINAVSNRNRTTLHSLADNENENIIRVARSLVSGGVSIEARDEDGRTALHLACSSGTRALCEYLIVETRADVKAVDNRNSTALHCLTENKNEKTAEIARLLVTEGVSIEARDKNGKTPLEIAREFGSSAFREFASTETEANIEAVE